MKECSRFRLAVKVLVMSARKVISIKVGIYILEFLSLF